MVGGIETVGFCEIDPWPREILKKNFPGVAIHDDVKTLDPKHYGRIDLITGGYPCQPFSLTGERKGAEDDRHLWPEVLRILKSAQPTWLLCENVYGHISMGIDQVLSDLEAADYAGWAFVIPACAVGAGHRRDRVWVVANRKGINGGGERNNEGGIKHLESAWEPRRGDLGERGEANHWSCEPGMGRVAHGIPPQVDRIKALGNAIVPQVAAEILRHMMEVNSLLPNDPKLSDGGGWRDGCAGEGGGAASVTAGAVRCSAWLGVGVFTVFIVPPLNGFGVLVE